MQINLKVNFEVNGAKLYPSDEQYSNIVKFAEKVIFGGAMAVGEKAEGSNLKKRGRPQGSKNGRTAVRYSVEEIRFIKARRAENLPWRKIAKQLYELYGVKRNAGALYQLLHKGLTSKKNQFIDPDEVVPVSGMDTALKHNEWGGTDGLSSPDL